MKKYTFLFAHFNARNEISEYVYFYLEYLCGLGGEVIFISNSALEEDCRSVLKKRVPACKVIERENRGNDFGAWKYALDMGLVPADTDQLVLTNDSCLGPLFDMRPVFRKMAEGPGFDFWGLSDSFQNGWHIQSYFLCLSKKVFDSPAFRKVFAQKFNAFTKKEIIQKGELHLSQALRDAGFKGGAYVSYQALDTARDPATSFNPTHQCWDRLIKEFRFPFVKKELVLKNPEDLASAGDVIPFIAKNTQYDTGIIVQLLRNALRPPDGSGGDPVARITVIAHIFYPASKYSFLLKIGVFRSQPAVFVFNLSTPLFNDDQYVEILRDSFPGAIIIHCPNLGRDIGGKMAAIDIGRRLDLRSDYTLIIHDKISGHTPTGREWRDKLFRIIDPNEWPKILGIFETQKNTGLIVSKDMIQNEYDPDNNRFRCTSSDNLIRYIKELGLELTNYEFAAGTIFWIRTEILNKFFSRHSAMALRASLEAGNALDFNLGTNIHAWERLFSLLANAQGYKITGI